jgi:hypothetical protein
MTMKRLALMFAFSMPLAACGGEKTVEGQLAAGQAMVEYPEWVNRGSGAFGGEKKVFYGGRFGLGHSQRLPGSFDLGQPSPGGNLEDLRDLLGLFDEGLRGLDHRR